MALSRSGFFQYLYTSIECYRPTASVNFVKLRMMYQLVSGWRVDAWNCVGWGWRNAYNWYISSCAVDVQKVYSFMIMVWEQFTENNTEQVQLLFRLPLGFFLKHTRWWSQNLIKMNVTSSISVWAVLQNYDSPLWASEVWATIRITGIT